jgi:hypothetical protein
MDLFTLFLCNYFEKFNFYEIGVTFDVLHSSKVVLPALIRQDRSLLLEFCYVFSGFQGKPWYGTT